MSTEHIQPRGSSPEDEAQALDLFRSVIAKEIEIQVDERADLKYVRVPFLGTDEMRAYVRLQELLKKDKQEPLTMEEIQQYSHAAKTLLAVPAEYSRMRANELDARVAEDPLITRDAFRHYLINELNAPYMRAQDREEDREDNP
ncbi:MAG: hypothetical protein AAB416_00605 [Patescibacteria group bacterium]